ncbi:MAG: hypothetical protein KDA28_13605, partial [Phycisphaerales bacterium]|nr:hypothetical protein [Phycisphaerales bacterium]
FYAGAIWAMYMALEPFMRRRGSNLIVSWARLLERRVRDPLISRDVLIGLTMGSVIAGLSVGARYLVEPLGGSATEPLGLAFLSQLHGLRWSLASFGNEHLLRVLEAVQFTFFFLVVQRALGWLLGAVLHERTASRVATIAAVVIFLVLMVGSANLPTPRDPVWLNLATRLLLVAGLLTALLRFGLICGSVYLIITWLLVATPFTMSLGSWYAQPTLVALSIAVGSAVVSTVYALGGPKVLSRMV